MLDSSSLRQKTDEEAARLSMRERLFPVHANIALASGAIIWGGFLIFTSLRIMLLEISSPGAVFVQHLLVTMFSVCLTWCLYRLLILVSQKDVAGSILFLGFTAILLAFVAAYAAQAIVNYDAVFLDFSHVILPVLDGDNWPVFLDKIFMRYLLFVGWGGLYLALVRDSAMKSAAGNIRLLEKVTRESQLRALRFQLNPHFVFNALNSVSSLIIEKKNRQAETLVDGLADYMREVLKDDDEHLVTVAQEIAQQVRYLEIEQVRFPDRLQYEVDVADDVSEWKIPALIVQPLIENAIKYGVAQSIVPVKIIITAKEEEGRLSLRISNDGRMLTGKAEHGGTGTGLVNIRERLNALYGAAAALVTANSDDGMATACIIIPKEASNNI